MRATAAEMRRLVRRRKGAAIVEYLVVAALVVAVVIAIAGGALKGNVNRLYQEAADKVGDAATALSQLQIP